MQDKSKDEMRARLQMALNLLGEVVPEDSGEVRLSEDWFVERDRLLAQDSPSAVISENLANLTNLKRK